MAEDWKELHTFTANEVVRAVHYEGLRQNLEHLRRPRYAVQYGKTTTPTDVTIGSGTGTSAWTLLSSTYLDQVDIVTSGNRDVIVVANPTGKVGNTSTSIQFGFNWDGVPLYSNVEGLANLTTAAASTLITLPIAYVIEAPTAGEHTLKFYYKTITSAASAIMLIDPKFFMVAMEI